MAEVKFLLELFNIRKYFPIEKGISGKLFSKEDEGESIKAVDGISFAIKKGDKFGICGESGCGKTTTARVITGLDFETAGDFRWKDKKYIPKERSKKQFRRNIQFIFQNPFSSLNPRMKIGNQISHALTIQGIFDKERKNASIKKNVGEWGLVLMFLLGIFSLIVGYTRNGNLSFLFEKYVLTIISFILLNYIFGTIVYNQLVGKSDNKIINYIIFAVDLALIGVIYFSMNNSYFTSLGFTSKQYFLYGITFMVFTFVIFYFIDKKFSKDKTRRKIWFYSVEISIILMFIVLMLTYLIYYSNRAMVDFISTSYADFLIVLIIFLIISYYIYHDTILNENIENTMNFGNMIGLKILIINSVVLFFQLTGDSDHSIIGLSIENYIIIGFVFLIISFVSYYFLTIRTRRKYYDGAVIQMLDKIGLNPPKDYYDKYPHELSGGERQRIAIARALIVNPELIVADEPTSMLDVSIRASILDLIQRLKDDFNLTVLLITHDLATAKYFCNRVAIMYVGKIVEEGLARDLFEHPKHPYTSALINAIPIPVANYQRSEKLPSGEVPDAAHPPSGCRFHPRCPLATDKCSQEEPQLVNIDSDHKVACFYPLN